MSMFSYLNNPSGGNAIGFSQIVGAFTSKVTPTYRFQGGRSYLAADTLLNTFLFLFGWRNPKVTFHSNNFPDSDHGNVMLFSKRIHRDVTRCIIKANAPYLVIRQFDWATEAMFLRRILHIVASATTKKMDRINANSHIASMANHRTTRHRPFKKFKCKSVNGAHSTTTTTHQTVAAICHDSTPQPAIFSKFNFRKETDKFRNTPVITAPQFRWRNWFAVFNSVNGNNCFIFNLFHDSSPYHNVKILSIGNSQP